MAQPITTVTDAAASYDLVTLENYKLDAGITVDTDDTYLERAISRSSAAIMNYCGRVFAVETVRDDFVAASGSSLVLSRYPVIEVESVTGAAVSYNLDKARGLLTATSGVWAGAVSVTYTAGFETIPMDLQGAVSEVVKALQFNRTRDPSLRSENILSGLYAYTLFDASNSSVGTAQQVSAILDSYRKRALA